MKLLITGDKSAFVVGDWQVRPAHNQIRNRQKVVRLKPLTMSIFVYLAERQGEVVDKEELLERFWQGRYTSDDAVHRRVADLRRVLGDDARNPRYIGTISKRGYYMVATVEPCQERRKPRKVSIGWIAAMAAVVVVLLVAIP